MVFLPHLDSVSKETWRKIEARAQAAFLAVALGDALGATTEFMTPHEIKYKYGVHKKMIGGGWLELSPGQVTDDTEMSLYMARAIDQTASWNLNAIADQFVNWMKSRPMDIGSTCARGIRTYIHKGTTMMPYNEWDAGNGAVMRMVPVTLFTLGNEKMLETYAVEQGRLTHHHPLSDAACITVGRMVQQAILGASLKDLRKIAEELIVKEPKFSFARYDGYSSPYIVDTLKTVFHFLFTTSNFKECIVKVVNQGGDADTTGAIAGMIAGPLYGLNHLPKQWLKRLDKKICAEIEELALKLVRRSPLAERRTS